MKRNTEIALFAFLMMLLFAAAPCASASDNSCAATLSRDTGADARGMRLYVLAILTDGPTPVTDPARLKKIVDGHFANIERLADEGILLTAGPFGKNDQGWRGLFLLATDSVDKAQDIMKTDPGVAAGVFAVEYHEWYGTAAAMHLPKLQRCIAPTVVE